MRIQVVDAERTRPLRRAVLRPGWAADAPMHGDDDPAAVHLALVEDGTVVSTCLLLPKPFPRRPGEPDAWQLRGMATQPERRSQGLGARLLAAAVETARSRGGRVLWCEARTSAMPFYERHGFAADGPEYLHAETAIPHHLMAMRI